MASGGVTVGFQNLCPINCIMTVPKRNVTVSGKGQSHKGLVHFPFSHHVLSEKRVWAALFLEKAMALHSSTLAWKIPWPEEPGRLQSTGSRRVGRTERLHFHFSLFCIGEGNGNPLQCSCLENPRDGGAWWAAVHWVTQNRTRLKRHSSSSSQSRRCKRWGLDP